MTIQKTIRIIFLSAIVLLISCSLFLVAYGYSDDGERPVDVAVIFGAKVWPNGTLSPILASRLNVGIQMYQAGATKNLLVSGGTGAEGVNEAKVMKDYLIAHGIPETAISSDTEGVDTAATACHTAILAKQRGWLNVGTVSSDYHIVRTRIALDQSGLNVAAQRASHLRDIRDIYNIPREVIALGYYLINDTRCK